MVQARAPLFTPPIPHLKEPRVCFCSFSKTSDLRLPAVPWANHRSLQPLTPRLKQSSHFSLLRGRNYRHAPLHLANFKKFFVEAGFTMLTRMVSIS